MNNEMVVRFIGVFGFEVWYCLKKRGYDVDDIKIDFKMGFLGIFIVKGLC